MCNYYCKLVQFSIKQNNKENHVTFNRAVCAVVKICGFDDLKLFFFGNEGTSYSQEGKGLWAVYYTSPQSFTITFS